MVIALHPDRVQRHHGEWRVSPLDDPESNLRKLKIALPLITECSTPRLLAYCKMPDESVSCDRAWHDVVGDGNEKTFVGHWS